MSTPDPVHVEDVMSTPLQTVSRSASVQEAATTMRDSDISALFVPAGSPAIVTSTDVLDVVAEGRDPAAVTVEEVMTSPVESVPPDVRLEEAAAMMISLDIKHLPVTAAEPLDDDYVGMVSSTDVTAELS
ncbi:MAG: cyclic nucleotide-binding/CBS domain-containing protein [Halobacteriales archaeon]